LASFTVPFRCMGVGYRHVPLLDARLNVVPLAGIHVNIKVTDLPKPEQTVTVTVDAPEKYERRASLSGPSALSTPVPASHRSPILGPNTSSPIVPLGAATGLGQSNHSLDSNSSTQSSLSTSQPNVSSKAASPISADMPLSQLLAAATAAARPLAQQTHVAPEAVAVVEPEKVEHEKVEHEKTQAVQQEKTPAAAEQEQVSPANAVEQPQAEQKE